jgi:hypothetical protein
VRAIACAVLVLALAACSGAPAPATQPGSSSSPAGTDATSAATSSGSTPTAQSTAAAASTSGSATDSPAPTATATPEAWDWPLDGDDDIAEDTDSTAGQPDGEQAGAAPTDQPSKPAKHPAEEPAIDPCALITSDDWIDFIFEVPAGAILEDGEACGWQNHDDDLRLALGVFSASLNSRYLSDEDRSVGTPVDGYGDRATWMEQWPIPQSSTLVIEIGARDVILEVSARGDTWPSRMEEVARHFADLVMARLPE